MLLHGVKYDKSAFVIAWLVVTMIQIVITFLFGIGLIGIALYVVNNWDKVSFSHKVSRSVVAAIQSFTFCIGHG